MNSKCTKGEAVAQEISIGGEIETKPENLGIHSTALLSPYYEDEWVTIYNGDARQILPQLPKVNTVITDPVWPNAIVELYGHEDPTGMFRQVWESMPELPERAAIHLGVDSDPRFLMAMPKMDFFRVCWLEYVRASYKGRLLMNNDVAYLFGSPPKSRTGLRVIPGMFKDSDSRGKQSGHPCPRKLKHVSWLVNKWTDENDVVLDFMMGSGTTPTSREGK